MNLPTRKLHWTAHLWPGLPQSWERGSWVGLAVAVGFTALLNVLILATFVYGDWITGGQRLTGYVILAVMCLAGWFIGRRQARRCGAGNAEGGEPVDQANDAPVASVGEQREQWYREAQQQYLRGDWVATEQLLLKLLKLESRDVEARLMLATLWRRQGRRGEALRQLDKLSRLEAAEKWQHEIAALRQEIAALASAPPEQHGKLESTELNNESSQRLAA